MILQGRRQLLAFYLIDPATHRLAGKEAGQVAGQGARRPQVMRVGKQAGAGQVQFAAAVDRFAPAPRHVGDGFRGTGQGAMQGVLGTTVDDALGLDGLLATEAGALHQHCRVTQATQAGIEPEACDPGADDQYVSGNGGWHGGTSKTGTAGKYTGCLSARQFWKTAESQPRRPRSWPCPASPVHPASAHRPPAPQR